jgi:dihydrolipoamide dehydrogenase
LHSVNLNQETMETADVIVIGGGYIGLELGQGLARLGSQTHLIVRGDRLLSQEEPDVSETLAEAFKQDGIW